MRLLLPALLCLTGGPAALLLKKRHSRNLFVFGITLLSSLLLVWICQAGDLPEFTLLRITELFSLSFRVDPSARIFLLLIAFLWPLASLYAFEYMASHPAGSGGAGSAASAGKGGSVSENAGDADKRESRFFVFYTVSYGITQLLAMSSGLFTLYVFYECLTLSTLPLVTYHEDGDSLRAGMTYLKYTVGGAALGLLGIIALASFGASGSFTPGGLLPAGLTFEQETFLHAVFLLSFLGFGSKAALFPLSPWLPRASVAPTPVTALLHAVAVVNAGVFACIRLIYDCFGPALLAGSWAQTAAILLSSFTILFGAVMAVRERHLKRRLAWSTVYHLSYMLFSASLMTSAGLAGAFTHLVFHGLMKISLFYCAGAFQIRAGAEYLPDLRGIRRAMPWTVGFYTLAALALTGVPPLIGFLSKWAILSAAVPAGSWPAWIGATAVILSSVLAAVYLLEPAVQMLFMQGEHAGASDPGWRILIPLGILAFCLVVPGIWPAPVRALIDAAALP